MSAKARTIALVGHCGPDATYLRIAASKADPEADVRLVDDESELKQLLGEGVDLLLINRELSYGFHDTLGVEMIRRLRAGHPHVRMILVSNYPEAQAEALEAGALPGFGKRQIGSPQVTRIIREALE